MGEIASFGADKEIAAAADLRMKCGEDLSATVFKSVINDYIRSEVGSWNMVDFLEGRVHKCEDGKLERIGHDLTAEVMTIILGKLKNKRAVNGTERSENMESEIRTTIMAAIVKNFRLMKEKYLEELDGKLHLVMKSVRSEFEDAMVARCREAIAAYEAKLTQADLQMDHLKGGLNLAETSYYRSEFVNRQQAERLVAMARTECGLKARIAALEERIAIGNDNIQRTRDNEVVKLSEMLVKKEDEIEQLTAENDRMKNEALIVQQEIEKLEGLLDKVENSSRSPLCGNLSGVLNTDGEDNEYETGQPLRKRPREEYETEAESKHQPNLSFARYTLLNSHRSLLEAGLKVRSTCAAIKEKATGVMDRLEDSCVIT